LGASRHTKEVSGEVQSPCCSLGRGSLLGRKKPCPREKGLLGPGGGRQILEHLAGVAPLIGISEVQRVEDIPGMSLGRTRKTSQKEES